MAKDARDNFNLTTPTDPNWTTYWDDIANGTHNAPYPSMSRYRNFVENMLELLTAQQNDSEFDDLFQTNAARPAMSLYDGLVGLASLMYWRVGATMRLQNFQASQT